MRTDGESSLSGVAAWISSKSSPSSSLCHLFQIESGGMPLLDTGPVAFESVSRQARNTSDPSRQRRRNSLAQPVRAGNSELRTGSPGGRNQIHRRCECRNRSATPLKLRFARDPIRLLKSNFIFLKLIFSPASPRIRSPRLRTTPIITPPQQCACKRCKPHWRAFYEPLLGTFCTREPFSRR